MAMWARILLNADGTVKEVTDANPFPIQVIRDEDPLAVTTTIINGGSVSGPITAEWRDIIGLIVPTFTSAALTFQVSTDGSNFYDLYDEVGNEVTVPASTFNRAIAAPLEVRGWKAVRIRSGTTATPVAQGAARTLTVLLGK